MNSPRFKRLVLCACSASLLISALAATTAQAGTVPTNLRVLTDTGRVLADVRQYTDTTSFPSSPQAKCFTGGQGGTGKTLTVYGPNALGAATDAAQSVPALNPVLVDDEFSFGLGVCGFGGVSSGPSNFWELRVDHKVSEVGGDKAAVSPGDDVLWSLVPANFDPVTFAPISEDELTLQVPARAKPRTPFNVTVLEYSPDGFLKPAVGAMVTGAPAPTDSQGHTKAILTGSGLVTASRFGAIPSRSLSVCVRGNIKKCPAKRGISIFGSDLADKIGGTLGNDTINARGGNDVISVRGRGRDTVDCGAGIDTVKADSTDKIDKATCEKIDRPSKK